MGDPMSRCRIVPSAASSQTASAKPKVCEAQYNCLFNRSPVEQA